MEEVKSLAIKTIEVQDRNLNGKAVKEVIVNGKWTAWVGQWNKDWAVGGVAKGVFEEKNSNGRTFYSIKCPQELRPKQFGQQQDNDLINKIYQEVLEIKKLLGGTVTPATQEDEFVTPEQPTTDTPPMPADEEEINIEDIPF